MKEIIRIYVSKYLTNEWAIQIAQKQWGTDAPPFVKQSRQYVFDRFVLDENDGFEVVAVASDNELVGRIHCVQNNSDPSLWYYGDLFVTPEYRRCGIAKEMIGAVIQHLSDLGASTLRCYVEPNNLPSRNLQNVLGFVEKPFEPFNDFDNAGEIMFERAIPSCFSCVPATAEDAYFVRILFVQNRDHLHIGDISMEEWRQRLSVDNDEEWHFLICKGAMPVAYMKIVKINGKKQIAMFFAVNGIDVDVVRSYALQCVENLNGECDE